MDPGSGNQAILSAEQLGSLPKKVKKRIATQLFESTLQDGLTRICEQRSLNPEVQGKSADILHR